MNPLLLVCLLALGSRAEDPLEEKKQEKRGISAGLQGGYDTASYDVQDSGYGASSYAGLYGQNGYDSRYGASSYGSGYGLGGYDPSAYNSLRGPEGHIISQTVEVTKPVAVPVYKAIGVPVPHPVPVAIPHPVPIQVPHPFPVHIPVAVPVVKTVAVPVERPVPYPVEKPYPVTVEKRVPYPVPKPYPVHVPVYKVKHIYHTPKVYTYTHHH